MLGNSASLILKYLRRVAESALSAELTDAELLDRFASRRDEAAFELLIWRHGPTVLGLCRRLLQHEQDAEDAFQAAFLTLARKAGSISKRQSLASWLYKVTYRIACRARSSIPVFSNHAALVAAKPAPVPEGDLVWRDLRAVLDREVAGLPEIYRRPIVLCYFEGKSHEEAARLLCCPKGTLAARLARARQRLRKRLTRRGWALSSAALATLITENALTAAVPASLTCVTVRSAVTFAGGKTAAKTIISAKAIALAEGGLRMLWYSKMKMVAGVLLAGVLAGAGIGLLVRHSWASAGPEDPPAVQANPLKPELRGDPKAEIAKLREEMGKLHRELASALKEIKDLKDVVRRTVPPSEEGLLYRGKTVRFWLDQLKDVDPKFRAEAVEAVAVFARRDKKLIRVLASALKDEDHTVGNTAALSLGFLGPEAVPVLSDALKDKALPERRGWAAQGLAQIGPRAKVAVPVLMQVLTEKGLSDRDRDLWVRASTLEALAAIGPAAKSAIPVLIDLVGQSLRALKDKHPEPRKGSLPVENILRVMLKIDPEIEDVLPRELRGLQHRAVSADDATLRQAYEALKKKYPKR